MNDAFDELRMKEQTCIEDYKQEKITLEERAKRLTDAIANYSEKHYFLYHKYPDIINLKKVYDNNEDSHIILKVIIAFRIDNERTIDEFFKVLNIVSNVKHHSDKLIFYEFLYKFERNTFIVDNDIINPSRSHNATINGPIFDAIMSYTPLKSMINTAYTLSQPLTGLRFSLFLCLNNGSEIYQFGDKMDDLGNIPPKYYKDLNRVFRSSWEANVARILIYNNIDWKYEDVFLLLQIGETKKGTPSTPYIPDFSLVGNNLIEVKGFWNTHSLNKVYAFKTKMFAFSTLAKINFKDFLKSYLYIIDYDMFYTLDKIYTKLIPNWDKMTCANNVQELLVVGITRPETKKYVNNLKIGDIIIFERDSKNKFDKNAVKVLNRDGNMIGFLSKEWACIYAEKIDMGMKFDGIIKSEEPKLLRISVQRTNFDEDILYDFLKPNIKGQ